MVGLLLPPGVGVGYIFNSKIDDADIGTCVVQLLSFHFDVPRDAITAKVEDGWMTLTGEVERNDQRTAAEEAWSGCSPSPSSGRSKQVPGQAAYAKNAPLS